MNRPKRLLVHAVPSSVVAALRANLARHQLRNQDLAGHLGISESRLSRFLNGRQPVPRDMAGRVRVAIAQLSNRAQQQGRGHAR
jgi:plasmid maintenance system antidote protein VapI